MKILTKKYSNQGEKQKFKNNKINPQKLDIYKFRIQTNISAFEKTREEGEEKLKPKENKVNLYYLNQESKQREINR